MTDVLRALFRALSSQFHPRMLWLAVWPFLLAIAAVGTVAWIFHEAALGALYHMVFGWSVIGWIDTALGWVGLDGFRVWIIPFLYFALVFATMVLVAFLIIAIVAMPAVVDHVAERHYPDLVRLHGGSGLVSGINALYATLVFMIGWLVTMPLWLIPPLVVILPLLWWGWLATRIFRYDVLAEHASAEERRELYARHGRGFFAIGVVVGAMNFVPLLFFVAPIFGGLAFTHYGLHALARLRLSRLPVAPSLNVTGTQPFRPDPDLVLLEADDPRTGAPAPVIIPPNH